MASTRTITSLLIIIISRLAAGIVVQRSTAVNPVRT